MAEIYVDTIDVAAKAFRVIIVHAEGNPARIVAYGAAAAVAFVGVAVGYGGYRLGAKLLEK